MAPYDGGVEVVVSDEGEGIPEETAARVFTRFWRGSRRGGTGLGLYIVKGLVEAHGGSVEVRRAPSGGAAFRFVLPAGHALLPLTGDPRAARLPRPPRPLGAALPCPLTCTPPPRSTPHRPTAWPRSPPPPTCPALAAARTAVLGDRSPVALARRGLGGLPGPERADAGKRVNAVVQALTAAHDARRAELEAERDARVLVEEAVDVTALPVAAARSAPATR